MCAILCLLKLKICCGQVGQKWGHIRKDIPNKSPNAPHVTTTHKPLSQRFLVCLAAALLGSSLNRIAAYKRAFLSAMK